MIDRHHTVVQRLVDDDYRVSLHAHLRDGAERVTVAATHPGTGDTLRGWAKDGTQAGALRDLAERAGWNLVAINAKGK